MSDEIWAGEVGMNYDPLEHTLEENEQALGSELAQYFENLKTQPPFESTAVVTAVDVKNKTITIGPKKPGFK